MTKEAQRKRPSDAPQTEAPYLSAGERRAKGKALRDKVPRASQAGWKPQKGRRDREFAGRVSIAVQSHGLAQMLYLMSSQFVDHTVAR